MKIVRSIAYKLVLFLVTASIIPLMLYGIVSLWQARQTAHEVIVTGNHRVATRAASQIAQYVDGALRILKSVGGNIKRTDLEEWQRQRILRNMILQFQEFKEISIFDSDGKLINSSAIGVPRISSSDMINKALDESRGGRDFISDVFLTSELTPSLIAVMPLVNLGEVINFIVAEIDLLHMWRFVGAVKIGDEGYLNVVLPNGKMVASGSGLLKKLVIQERNYPSMILLHDMLAQGGNNPKFAIRNSGDRKYLLSIAKLPDPLGWLAVVEQPLDEAYALSYRMTWMLGVLVLLFVIVVTIFGFWIGRLQILEPIQKLIRGTRSVSSGDLEYEVNLNRKDEFGELATAFNHMTRNLKVAQENIRRNERLATFGRIASGLIHDLKHPIKSIENASRLMDRMYDDPEYRKTFARTVHREFEKVNNFLSNLHTLTHDIPWNPIRLEIRPIIEGVLETFSEQARQNAVKAEMDIPVEPIEIYADKVSITRALSNIVLNGIQAMPKGGELHIGVRCLKDSFGKWIEMLISDTGCGISQDRLSDIFRDFVTTKRKGLGLGLALTKRILDQHSAQVNIKSDIGIGTTFQIRFPSVE